MAESRKIFAGNWKMNTAPTEAANFIETFCDQIGAASGRSIILFPPAISVSAVKAALPDRCDVELGVQNVHWEAEGAFTGEISVGMARDAGASFALIGHSERRHVFGESIQETVRKVNAVLEGGLTAVVCVGETLEQRRAGRANEVVSTQLDPVLHAVEEGMSSHILMAYEPVWAIGTGETASPDDAAQMHRFIRSRLGDRFSQANAASVPILYGGSVKPDNAAELLAQQNVNGLLVGGASLDPTTFSRICLTSA